MPHTVEEAYELADAAQAGDDGKLLDELGDVLFQVYFLALLLEERGAGDLAAVAEHCTTKLIRRHPHVFGEVDASDAAKVLRNWDRIKQDEPGRETQPFGDLPQNLPATIHARKVLRRSGAATESIARAAERLSSTGSDRQERFEAVGELMLAAVGAAAQLGVDPELALRAAAQRRGEEAGRASGAPVSEGAAGR